MAVWHSNEDLGGIGSDVDIFVARSTDDGATWSDVAALNENAGNDGGADRNAQVATDGGGNWLTVWRSNTNLSGGTQDLDILVARSTNNGATWSHVAALNTNAATDSGDDYSPQVTTDGGGNWVAVWTSYDSLGGIGMDADILVARSTTQSSWPSWTWTAPAALNTSAASDSGYDGGSAVTTDGGGNWVAVWRSGEDLDGIGTDGDILTAHSIDNGATWSDPVALNTDAATDSESGPTDTDECCQLATDGAGHWVAIWHSYEDLGGIGTDADIFVARSTDNGATWTDPDALNSSATTDSSDD